MTQRQILNKCDKDYFEGVFLSERRRMDCIMLLPGKKNYWCSPVDFIVHDV